MQAVPQTNIRVMCFGSMFLLTYAAVPRLSCLPLTQCVNVLSPRPSVVYTVSNVEFDDSK